MSTWLIGCRKFALWPPIQWVHIDFDFEINEHSLRLDRPVICIEPNTILHVRGPWWLGVGCPHRHLRLGCPCMCHASVGSRSLSGGLGAHAAEGHTAEADQDAEDDWKHNEDEHAEDNDDDDASGQAARRIFPITVAAVQGASPARRRARRAI